MKHFPEFLKSPKNKIDQIQHYTDDIEGYVFEGADDLQIAFWECHSDQESQKHIHDFEEYMICVSGEYTAYLNDAEIIPDPAEVI